MAKQNKRGERNRKVKRCSLFFLFVILHLGCSSEDNNIEEEVFKEEDLIDWLSEDIENRTPIASAGFSITSLSKSEAAKASELLIQDRKNSMKQKYGSQWADRVLEMQALKMPFYYQSFGLAPSDGRSLFISLHGGGGTTAAINNKQYENQKHLYDQTLASMEGIYLAPRAPNNSWNLWHQAHIDDFLDVLIQMAIINENVNPNKVYIMGYSAGGDGVYQLAPRMADRWAAAAMMAGHPNETSPLGLKNTPFALNMGALDSAYNRNLKAQEWREMLGQLQSEAPGTYLHDVQIHKGLGHWMNLLDAAALPWMVQYRRNPLPKNVVWKQDDRHHSRFYWLGIPQKQIQTGGEIIASYDRSNNSIDIFKNYSTILHLYVNDNMLDLDQPISVQYQGKEIAQKKFERTTIQLYQSIQERGDQSLVFPVKISVSENTRLIE